MTTLTNDTHPTGPRDGWHLDRAAGVLLGAAVGDALGVPYEFARTLGEDEVPQMKGGGLGPYAPGEYSDDTQMAVCIAQALVEDAGDPVAPATLNAIAENFLAWRREGATDIGNQTASVLAAAERASNTPHVAEVMAEAARARAASGTPSAGNGSLMRTGPVALAHLEDAEATARAARVVSELTHADPLAQEACVLWCAGIRHAVAHGDFAGVRNGLALLAPNRRAQWAAWLDEAETHPPRAFNPNGFVVAALQAAWSAITRTPVPPQDPGAGSFPAQHFQHALENAVRAGNDTDTVAAIAGALLGARWGASAIPWHFQRRVHGWPHQRATDLIGLGLGIATRNRPDAHGWPRAPHHPRPTDPALPFAVAHPHDEGVILGNLHLADAEVEAEAVVSLCRVGRADFPTVGPENQARIWLIDQAGANTHPHYVIDQAAHAVATLRGEGKRVLLHCAAGRSRTPIVAARYATLAHGLDTTTALSEVLAALEPNRPTPNPELEQVLYELAGDRQRSSRGRP